MALYQLLEKVTLVRRSGNINIDLIFPGCLKTALKAQFLFSCPAEQVVFKGNENYYPHVMDRGGNKYGMGSHSEFVTTFVCPAALPALAFLSLVPLYLSFQFHKKYLQWKKIVFTKSKYF